MPILCKVAHCKFVSNKFGVCSRHRKYACHSNEVNFIKDIEYYQYLYYKYQTEIYILEENGFRTISNFEVLLEVQNIKSKDKKLSSSIASIVDIKKKLQELRLELLFKYDAILVQNSILRIHHSYLFCKCTLCKIQIEYIT
jgi:hypothetical protein